MALEDQDFEEAGGETPEERKATFDDMSLGLWGSELSGMLSQNLGMRQPIEERWVDALTQYYGYRDKDATRPDRPDIGYNRTRMKVNAGVGRLCDLLFGSGDKNWSIDSSPVPELIQRIGDKSPAVYQGQAFTKPDGAPLTEGDVARREPEIS